MVQRGSICFHPSRPQLTRGTLAGVITGNWEPTTDYLATIFCSATAAAFPRIHQKIKRLTPQTPPVLSGTGAVQFAANPNPARRPGWRTVSASPKICTEIINIGGCSTAVLGGKRAYF